MPNTRRAPILGDGAIIPKALPGLPIRKPLEGLEGVKPCAGLGSIIASSGETGVIDRCNTGAAGVHMDWGLAVDDMGVPQNDRDETDRNGLPRSRVLHGLNGVGMLRKTGGAGGHTPGSTPNLSLGCPVAGSAMAMR